MTRRISLGCALLAILVGACQQTVVLDDLSPDGGLSGTGGKNGSGGSGGSRPTDASTDGNCGQVQQIIATGDVPQVVVALDRSSEMLGTQFGGGQNNTEFTAAVSDLSAQVGSYSPSGQHSSRRAISFAYLEFPESASDCSYPGCCSSDVTPTASYQAFTDATMTCSLLGNACGSSSAHPIAAALSRAQEYFQLGTFGVQSEERYVLLVTDDAPDGNCSTENDCQKAQDQVYSLANSPLNVTTVIIYVGTGGSTSCLQDFAATQGAPPAWYAGTNLYYAAPMPDDLQNAVATAISAIAAGTCRFTLSTTPGSPSQLTVISQGTTLLPQDSKNGWTYEGGSGTPRLSLHGSACTSYLNSQFGLQVYQGCVPDHITNP